MEYSVSFSSLKPTSLGQRVFSWVDFHTTSVSQICKAVTWSSIHTFSKVDVFSVARFTAIALGFPFSNFFLLLCPTMDN